MLINFIIPGWLFGIGYLVYSIVGVKKQLGNIGHAAHFGGAIAGYVLAIVLGQHFALSKTLIQPIPFVNFGVEQVTLTVLIGLPILVLFYMIKTNKI